MGDVNKTTHTGMALTRPTFAYLNSKTPMAIFTLKVRETWRDGEGRPQSRDNLLKMEALKKNAFWVKDNVKVGHRYYIDGYVRNDNLGDKEDFKIRILHIEPEDNDNFQDGKRVGIRDGLAQALSILKNTGDTRKAIEMIEIVLE
jgi:single-stranded DNA-binding protein